MTEPRGGGPTDAGAPDEVRADGRVGRVELTSWVTPIGRVVASFFTAIGRRIGAHPALALTLAVGIGACTAVFSFAGAVLLRPLPFHDAASVVRLFETNPLRGWTRNIASPANYADWRARNTVFTDVAACLLACLTDPTTIGQSLGVSG